MSNERKWTPSQTLAMQTHGRTLLVSAAAGSGKTATLTERIIRRITDKENPAELSRMLIVTFTRAAAAELKERISQAISAQIAADPTNRHLQKQLLHLGSAHIHTIDAFCYLPVKENFAEMGMPASFRIADDAELSPLSERIMGDLIDEFYQKYAPSTPSEGLFSLLEGNSFADLCDSLTPSKNDATLTKTLKDLYDKLLNFPEELSRLQTQAERLALQADGDFLVSDHGKIIKSWMLLFCESRLIFLDDAIDRISESAAASKAYLEGFTQERTFLLLLQQALKQETYTSVKDLMQGYEPGGLNPLRNAEPIYAYLRDQKKALVTAIREMRDTYFTDSQDAISQQMKTLSVLCGVLYDFLVTYDKRMSDEKIRRGICDFTDNRRKLLKMLMDEHGKPTPLCLSYLENFDEVYIDEYQDVDEVQDTIFRLIGGDHRFMVGDIKQSIYGFRGADPSVFAGYRQRLTPLSQGDDKNGNSIFMSENFRCDESVIRLTNAVCGHIFRACPDTIAYQPEDDLQFGKKKPSSDYVTPPVHIALIEALPRGAEKGEISGCMAEAVYVANQIAMLLQSGATKADGTKIEPKDIAILSRGSTHFGEYMTALAMLGIPTGCAELETVRATRDVLHGPDMMYLLNLMRVINNPDNDIPLSEILRGEFPGFSLDDVITIRESGETHGSLFSALEHYLQEDHASPEIISKIKHFLQWLTYYRSLSVTLSAEGLLRVLRQDSRVDCRQTKAFTYLYDAARGCRVAPFVGLYTFLTFIESKILTSKNAPAEQESQIPGGTVKLMTIHKSKGLEFPVCFVVRCGQAFSSKELSKDLLFDKFSGIATKLYNRSTQRKHDSLLRLATALSIKIKNREDEMRILYVAMTRARERLYLVGYDVNDETFEADDRYMALSCNNYMTWIKAGIAMHPEIQDFYEVHRVSEGDIAPLDPLSQTNLGEQDSVEQDMATYYQNILASWSPPSAMDAMLRSIPTIVPASRMSEHLLDECVFATTTLPPMGEDDTPISEEGDFCHVDTIQNIKRSVELMRRSGVNEFELLLKENARPTAAEKGTATHLFLQYCNWENVRTHGLEEEISRLLEQEFINSRVAKILDRKQISAFFSSRFFAHVTGATSVERELKFLRFVPLRNLTSNPQLAAALGDRTLSVQGSIDLVCHFADGRIELCDYKSDRLTPEELASEDSALVALHMKEKHGAQLREYAEAIKEMYGKYPDRIYIYALSLGEAVEIDI